MHLENDRAGLRRIVALTAILLVAVLGVFSLVYQNVNQRAEIEPGIHLYLTPHPDDELQGWSSLTSDLSIYPVFIVMTRGEISGRCKPESKMSEQSLALGALPPPVEPTGTGETCGDARIALWNMMLDEAGKMDKSARLGNNVSEYSETIAGRNAEVWVGSNSARISLDLGDGDLEQADVVKAVKEIIALRGSKLPDMPVSVITTSAYYNNPDVDPDLYSEQALGYPHPDHLAVTNAGIDLAPLALDGSWISTHPFDPRATHRKQINPEFYDYMMGLGDPNSDETAPELWEGWKVPTRDLTISTKTTALKDVPEYPYTNVKENKNFTDSGTSELAALPKLGVYQRVFGWLAFPDPWVPGKYQLADSDSLFAQENFFIHVPSGKR